MHVGSARGSLKTKIEVVSIEDIKRASIQISEAQRALHELVTGREIPPPWNEEHVLCLTPC
jgi:hypothetical protein